MTPQVFLISPANCSGQRAKLLLSERADFALARQLRKSGAPLGDVFSFLSGLYFRGKLTYARAFAEPSGIFVITAGRGLLPADVVVGPGIIQEFQSIPIDLNEPRYREPMVRDAKQLAQRVPQGQVVLLGSIATKKYTGVLEAAFGERIVFPAAFVGRGDMSRGGLLLRAVDEGRELEYVPIAGAARRGSRPGRLGPRGGTSEPE